MSEHQTGGPDVPDELRRTSSRMTLTMLQAQGQREQLAAFVRKGLDWAARMEERYPREPPSQRVIELLEAITSEPTAKDSWRVVGDSVRSGTTTWTNVWLSGDYGVVGLELRLEVTRRMIQTMHSFDEIPAEEGRLPPAEPPPPNVLR